MTTKDLKAVMDALAESLSNTWQDQARKVEVENILATLTAFSYARPENVHTETPNSIHDVQEALDAISIYDDNLSYCQRMLAIQTYMDDFNVHPMKTLIKLSRAALTAQQQPVNAGLLNTLNKDEFDLGVEKSTVRLLKELCDQKDKRIAELLEALQVAERRLEKCGEEPDSQVMEIIDKAITRAEQKGGE